MPDLSEKGIRAAQLGILVNALLAVTKLLAGVVGNSYALIADAVESSADILSSLLVMGGLQCGRALSTNAVRPSLRKAICMSAGYLRTAVSLSPFCRGRHE